MAGRFPFNAQGHNGQNPLHDAQLRAALGLSEQEARLYLQRQQELQRDFQIRQMLFQDQIDQQNRFDSLVAEQRLKQIREQLHEFPADLQQHYSRLLRDQLQREQEERTFLERAQLQQQEELQRRALGQNQGQQQPQQLSAAQAQPKSPSKGTNVQTAHAALLRDIAADSLAGNAVKRSELEKRVYAKPDEEAAPPKKRQRSGTEDDSGETDRKPASKKKKKEKKTQKKEESPKIAEEKVENDSSKETAMKPSAQALLDLAISSAEKVPTPASPVPPQKSPPKESHKVESPRGTIDQLLVAAQTEQKNDAAASTLVAIKDHVEWSDSEDEEDESETEEQVAIEKGDSIVLPNFTSILPQLPEEPKLSIEEKKKKKHKGLLDDDSIDHEANGKTKAEKKTAKASSGESKPPELSIIEYPYPIDTWWPSVTSIRKERKSVGEPQDEDVFEEEPDVVDTNSPFRINIEKIRDRFATEVSPGVLEKIPHCRIHRMLMKKRKNPSAPELVYCFQVTELYPNDVMVCCSHCGTWRHTTCGGHYKPYSVRECIDSPFTAVCDRCHKEEKILRDYPMARKRIDRQRSEQVRRGLATSAAMRQASFSKHGGTYKWPLGSVSATHIGGHTRSVHSRHDKAEKQWMDMATRLGRGYGYRPKERVKVRTKELERLLVSVEDAEGHTDRHNMMLFLLQDTLKEHPVGFETRRRNIFDPDEDDMPSEAMDPSAPESPSKESESSFKEVGLHDDEQDGDYDDDEEDDVRQKTEPSVCSRSGCIQKPRFDSLFCSDSCGVSALESDLLRTFQYSSDIHPSLLRN